MSNHPATITDYMGRSGWRERVNASLMGVMSCDAFNAGCLAALSDPKLQQCSAESLGQAFLKCASLGLMPGPQQLVSLIPRRGEITVMLGWRGIACLFNRLPHVKEVTAYLVHTDDPFDMVGDQVVHERDPFDREVTSADNCRGGYLRITYTDGRPDKYHVTSVRKILENRGTAGASGPWRDYFAPMALKTVYRDAWARAAVAFEPGAPPAQHILNAELHERDANDEDPARVTRQSPAAAALTYDTTARAGDSLP